MNWIQSSEYFVSYMVPGGYTGDIRKNTTDEWKNDERKGTGLFFSVFYFDVYFRLQIL